jgi:hypothetical protein
MRKLLTFLICTLFLWTWSDLSGQCTLSSSATAAFQSEFCSECPNGSNVVTGIVLQIGGTVTATLPANCGGTPYTLGNSTVTPIVINLNNDNLVIPGSVVITGLIDFQGDGNASINFGGQVFSANGSVGGTYAELEAAIGECLSSPPPGGCTVAYIAALLPVELTRFEVAAGDRIVELEWTTASELNNDFFQIEHSLNSIDFYPVGKVKGNGTTNETVEYNFMHRQPSFGTNYYRLKQVDYDGAFEYSDVKAIQLNGRTSGINIFPNPTTGRATVTISQRPENVKFTLSNLLGQSLDLQPVPTGSGWEVDVSGLAKGIYVLRMDYLGKTVIRKLIRE